MRDPGGGAGAWRLLGVSVRLHAHWGLEVGGAGWRKSKGQGPRNQNCGSLEWGRGGWEEAVGATCQWAGRALTYLAVGEPFQGRSRSQPRATVNLSGNTPGTEHVCPEQGGQVLSCGSALSACASSWGEPHPHRSTWACQGLRGHFPWAAWPHHPFLGPGSQPGYLEVD